MAMVRRRIVAGMLAALLAAPATLSAQSSDATETAVPKGQILTITADRLFAESAFGRSVLARLEAEGEELAVENERIIAELSRDEAELTERRATTDAETFRELADAFDRKVEEHRNNQKAKLDALTLSRERSRAVFFDAVRPVLETLMRDAGAGVILERSSVFLSANTTDVTALAIARIDAAIGDGAELESPGQQ